MQDHLYLVRNFIRSKIDVSRLPRSIDRDDLFQIGCLAIMRCAKDFASKNGAKFSTYADKVMRWEIFRHIANERWGPSHSTQHRNAQMGKKHTEDMVSYDALPNALSFIESMQDDSGEFKSRLTSESATRVLKSINYLETRKQDKRAKHGRSGVYFKTRTGKYHADLRICGVSFQVGVFDNPAEALTERAQFLANLKEKCQEALSLQ